jgi:hypothetical protein
VLKPMHAHLVDRPSYVGRQLSRGEKSSMTIVPPRVRTSRGMSLESPAFFPAPPPSTTKRSNGPYSTTLDHSLVTIVTLRRWANSCETRVARASSFSTLTILDWASAALAIHANPTPQPVPVSPTVAPERPLTSTASRRPWAGRHEQSNCWKRAKSTAASTRGDRSRSRW